MAHVRLIGGMTRRSPTLAANALSSSRRATTSHHSESPRLVFTVTKPIDPVLVQNRTTSGAQYARSLSSPAVSVYAPRYMDHEQTSQAPAAQSQTIESLAPQPEPIQIFFPDSAESNGVPGCDTRSSSSSTTLLHPTSEGHPAQSHSNENTYTDLERVPTALLHLPATLTDMCAYHPAAELGCLDSPIRMRLVSIELSLWKKKRMWVLSFWLSGRPAYFVHHTRRSVP